MTDRGSWCPHATRDTDPALQMWSFDTGSGPAAELTGAGAERLSSGCVATVDGEDRPRCIGGAGEPEDGVGDLLGLGDPPQRDVGQELLADPAGHAGAGHPRGDRIHAY